MNIYMLVEGRRTEMAVYPAWMSYLLPFLQQVKFPYEARRDHLYVVSGFGYPNLLHHIANCVREVNRYHRFDYLVICLDSDDTNVKDRILEIEHILNKEELWPQRAQIKVLVQKKCIETWFLGSDLNLQGEMTQKLIPYMDHYNVFKQDPQNMEKPEGYRGSVGDFHFHYLCRLLEANGGFYSKRRPERVCSPDYIESLRRRVYGTDHLSTLHNFFEFCAMLQRQHKEEVALRNALAEMDAELLMEEAPEM